jgi:small subunit ribosomal protein S5
MKKVGKDVDNQHEIIEKVIKINRVTKVVKGGKRLAFRAFVISGDRNGNVSFSLGKSKEVPVAIRKAIERGKSSMKKINIINGTLAHEVIGIYGASRVIIKPAKPGTGVIAGGAVRILLEAVGLRNVIAKSLGSRNPVNSTKAAMNGLLSCRNLQEEEKIRGKKLSGFVYKEDKESDEVVVQKEIKDTREGNKKESGKDSKGKDSKEKDSKQKSEKEDKKEVENKDEIVDTSQVDDRKAVKSEERTPVEKAQSESSDNKKEG